MQQLKELVIFENKNGLEVEEFNKVKGLISKKLDEEYKTFEILSVNDYQNAKQCRAILNKQAKEINDSKIAWVNDLTLKVKEQTKEICDLIKSKSEEFNEIITSWENQKREELGLNIKEKVKYELTIKFTSKEELDKYLAKLPKKYNYTIKEK